MEASVPREITIATDANTKCTVHSSASADSMPVWADDMGIVHLWSPPTPEKMFLQCDEDGQMVEYLLDLADEATFTPATPRVVSTARTALPALTDPLGPSQEELIKAGYPPRPDPVRAAPLYQQWLDIVATRAVLLKPHVIERPEIHLFNYSNVSSDNWGGTIMDVTAVRYTWSLATISSVPGFSSGGFPHSVISMWAGLDGSSGATDLIQNGIYYEFFVTGTYYYVYEYVPNHIRLVSGFTSPGNSVTFWAWEGDAACVNGAGHTGYGCFWGKNNTTGLVIATIAIQAPNALFQGKTAEAIAERPGGALNGYPLSKFTTLATMQMSAVDSTGAWHSITSDHFKNSTLINGSGQAMLDTEFCCSNYTTWTWLQGN